MIFTVMIVDDTFANVLSIKNIFQCVKSKFKLNIICKKDGDESVDTFKTTNKTESKDNVHLIIMDQNMNKMHGDEATRIVILLY